MPEIKMIYNLNDWPEGHVGHLVPSEEVVNAFIEINKTHPIRNVLEFGFNTGWSTYIILKTLGETTVTSIEIYKFNNAEIAVQRLKDMFRDRTNIIWGDSREIYKKVLKNKTETEIKLSMLDLESEKEVKIYQIMSISVKNKDD